MNHQKNNTLPSFRKNHSSTHHSHLKKNDLAKRHSFIGQFCQWNSESEQSSSHSQEEYSAQCKMSWTEDENKHLASLFIQFQSDWVQISEKIQHRSPNQVKIQFYSILRKIVERVNLELKEKGRKEIPFKSIQKGIQRILQCGDEQSIIKDVIKSKLSKLIIDYLASNQQFQKNSLSKSIEALQNILTNLKRYRKKRSISDKTSSTVSFKQDLENKKMEEGYMSDESSVSQQSKKEENNLVLDKHTHKNYYADEQNNDRSSSHSHKGVIVEQNQQRIKNLLRESGILEMVQYYSSAKDLGANYQQSVASSSQNMNNESYQHFFIDEKHRIQNNYEENRIFQDSQNL